MAKLRLKLMTQRKSKERKMQHQGKKSVDSRCLQHLQQPSKTLHVPYIRCGKSLKVLPSSDEHHKLPNSPVNKKAADISFPCTPPPRGTASVPVTPVPKKWLTLGCDPCKQQRSLLHEDYKLQTRAAPAAATATLHQHAKRGGSSAAAAQEISSSPPVEELRVASPRDWQQEMCWKVVARSENEFVRKRVVLQRKKSSSSCSSSVFKPLESSFKNSLVVVDETCEALGEGRRNSFESRGGAGFKSGSEAPVYKLTTTSPDQSMENDSFYAWDKDLSPFASESSIFTSFDSPSTMIKPSGRGSKASSDNRKSVTSSRYGVARTPSPGSSSSKACQEGERLNWSPSPPLLPAQFDELYQGVHNDPEAVSKSWERFRPCPSPLDIDEETVPHQHKPSSSSTSSSSSSPSPPSEYLCIQERESKRKEKKDKRKHKRREFTSRVTESFAVEKTTVNPYKDFRESMIEMILKKDLLDHRDLEELLRSYLVLNSEEFHDLIVRVFTDLWYQLFCYDSS